jgi:Na+/H+-dicarboxylate symporter/ABC-type amino acid transport substrate-binding protein
MQLSVKVLIGLGLGIVAGIFFGEYAASVKIFGDIFILSLQMTVLPYIMVSLITGLGELSFKTAAMLAKKCGWVILILWGIGIIMVLIMPMAFPKWEMASFFTASQIEPKPEFNFLGFYIPSNIFYSLANNIVPAVVVFSLAVGVALIGIKNKEALIKTLKPFEQALGRITNFLVSLAPFGVFAIIASYLGVMRFDELERLQVYMIDYLVFALLLTFWILPSLVTGLTPFRYKELVDPAKTALITAFATGNIFIVLPVLSEISKELLKTRSNVQENSDSAVDVIIPASFSFPNMGKILSMSFVLFAGWFANAVIPAAKYPAFAFTGFFSFFGDLTIAIPSLLNIFRIPSDTFHFFLIADNLVGARFGTLLAAMYTLVLAVLGASAVSGLLIIKWKKLITNFIISAVIITFSIVALRVFYEHVLKYKYKEYNTLVSMEMVQQYPPATVYGKGLPSPLKHDPGLSRVAEIKDRDTIRVGYYKDALPFAFINKAGDPVGFDIEMAYILAREMNVKLGLVAVERNQGVSMLNDGYIDLMMSGTAVTLDNVALMGFTAPYMNQTFAFVVKDYRLNEFNSREKVKNLKNLKIGILKSPYYIEKVKHYLPQAEIVVLDTPDDFFSNQGNNLDAFAYSAEAGSAWSLIYPAYTVAIPYPDILEVPLAYAMAKGDTEFKSYLDTWIDLKKRDRIINSLYDHWIQGKGVTNTKPRWSVIRDVLHWIS